MELAFVTGVTRSSSLFVGSAGEDFQDISDDPKYAELVGITENELCQYFGREIIRLATGRKVKVEIMEELRVWYNGLKCVYNPLSVVNYFQIGLAINHWAKAASSTFLLNQLKNRPKSFQNMKSDVQTKL